MPFPVRMISLMNPQSRQQADERYQARILKGVSRTFALTIPQLPRPLAMVVGNAYLLCRIADTIEDDKALAARAKREFAERFIQVVRGIEAAEDFAAALHPALSGSATADEKALIQNTAAVIRITHSFNARQRAALERCIRLMAQGMSRYQEGDVQHGLKDLPDMDNYCYFVAGVVGEMLTELFCDYSKSIDEHREQLMQLAPSFGQGLQMTNILKDIWDDQQRNMCWLPRDIFGQYGVDLSALENNAGFRQGLGRLLGVAHAHLANALRYTLLLPKNETGLRRFCLWALGMAVLTLRKINRQRHFTRSEEVKISRRSVQATIFFSNLFTRYDGMLGLLFALAACGLPKQALAEKFHPATDTD